MKCSREYICVADAVEYRMYSKSSQRWSAFTKRRRRTCNIRTLYYYSLCHLRFLEKEYINIGGRKRELYMYIFALFVILAIEYGNINSAIFTPTRVHIARRISIFNYATDVLSIPTPGKTLSKWSLKKKNDILSGR